MLKIYGLRFRSAVELDSGKKYLADESTENMDLKTIKLILRKICDHVEKTAGAILITTHSNVAAIADVVISIEDDKIISIKDKAC